MPVIFQNQMTYDPEADALSIRLGKAGEQSVRTVREHPGVLLDFSADGTLIQIEVLDASASYDRAWLAALGSPAVWLSLAQAAKESGLAPATLRVQLNRGRLSGEKRGRDWLVARHELWTYLESRAPQGRPALKPVARRRPRARAKR